MITDVIYSSKESSNDELTTTGSKEELERIKVWTGVLYVVVHNVEPLSSASHQGYLHIPFECGVLTFWCAVTCTVACIHFDS